jgi:hypothetical protein
VLVVLVTGEMKTRSFSPNTADEGCRKEMVMVTGGKLKSPPKPDHHDRQNSPTAEMCGLWAVGCGLWAVGRGQLFYEIHFNNIKYNYMRYSGI